MAEFDPQEHPRDDSGKFAPKGSGSIAPGQDVEHVSKHALVPEGPWKAAGKEGAAEKVAYDVLLLDKSDYKAPGEYEEAKARAEAIQVIAKETIAALPAWHASLALREHKLAMGITVLGYPKLQDEGGDNVAGETSISKTAGSTSANHATFMALYPGAMVKHKLSPATVVAHEFGHALDGASGSDSTRLSTLYVKKAGAAVSSYGDKDPNEAFAEAYATYAAPTGRKWMALRYPEAHQFMSALFDAPDYESAWNKIQGMGDTAYRPSYRNKPGVTKDEPWPGSKREAEFDPSEHPRDDAGKFSQKAAMRAQSNEARAADARARKTGETVVRGPVKTESGDVVVQSGHTTFHITDRKSLTPEETGKQAEVDILRADAGGYDTLPADAVETRRAMVAGVRYLKSSGYKHLVASPVNPGVHRLLTRLGAVPDPDYPANSGRLRLPLSAIKHESEFCEAWDPGEHPRADDGKFTDKGGSNGGKIARGAKAGGLRDGGRVPERAGVLAAQGRPLDGLPTGSPGPFARAREVAAEYVASTGREYRAPTEFVPVDPKKGAEVARDFDRMADAPGSPEVRRAYSALRTETNEQFSAMLKTGLKVEPIDFAKTGDPYHGNAEEMFRDVRENNHAWYFRTADGFGTPGALEASKHPLLTSSGFKDAKGNEMLANDVFRVVHDYFGHNKEGVGFDPSGEDNAWRSHLAMYSPEAGRAMTTETRGQTSWVYFGPHGADNREGKKPTVFADQKAGLLPAPAREAFLERSADEKGLIDPDGKYHVGQSGEHHEDIAERLGIDEPPQHQLDPGEAPRPMGTGYLEDGWVRYQRADTELGRPSLVIEFADGNDVARKNAMKLIDKYPGSSRFYIDTTKKDGSMATSVVRNTSEEARSHVSGLWNEEDHPRDKKTGEFTFKAKETFDPGKHRRDEHGRWAAAAGGRVNGYQEFPGGTPHLVVTDRKTNSTGMIPVDQASPASIRAKFEDIRRRFAAEAPARRESAPRWGVDRLVEAARVVQQPGSPEHAYAAVRLGLLAEVSARGLRARWCQSPWTARQVSEGRCAVVRAPRSLLPGGAVPGRALEVLTEAGWRSMAAVPDSPTPQRLEVARWRPSAAVLARWPEAGSLQVPDLPGRLAVAVVSAEVARLHALRAAAGERGEAGISEAVAERPRDYPTLVERLAREAWDPQEHPRAEDGKFTSGGWVASDEVPDFPGRGEPGQRISKVQLADIGQLAPTEEKVDQKKVAAIAKAMEDGEPLPAIVVNFSHKSTDDADILDVVDGHHRLLAAKKLGMTEVPVRVVVDNDFSGGSLRLVRGSPEQVAKARAQEASRVENRTSAVEKDHLAVWRVEPGQRRPRADQLVLAGSLATGRLLWEADANDTRQGDGRRVRYALMVPEGGKVWAVRVRGAGWCLPGGHREVGEARGAAAVREMVEETGLRCRLEGLAGRIDGPDFTTVVFLGSRAPGAPDPVPQADEVEDVALVDPGALNLGERFWVADRMPR